MPPMGVTSLFDLAQRQCVRFAHLIADIGDTPYELLVPVFKRMTGNQFAQLEDRCTHLKEHSGEMWLYYIRRDFTDRPSPRDRFRETYMTYQKERDEQLQSASDRLRESMKQYQQERASRGITTIETAPRPARSRYSSTHGFRSMTTPGSRLMNMARNAARAQGRKFASSNAQFAKTSAQPFGSTMALSRANRPASLPGKIHPSPLPSTATNAPVSVHSSVKSGTITVTKQPMSDSSPPKKRMRIDSGLSNLPKPTSDLKQRADPGPRTPRKKPPSVFIPRRS